MPEVAPRIRRIGHEIVNSYLVEHDGEIVIVDAGAPSYWRLMLAELEAMGRSFDDVRAVLLTHAHFDHTGYAERARRGGVTIRVHEADARLARGEARTSVKIARPIRLRPALGFLAFAARQGLIRVPKIREVVTFNDGATLDVPGSPRVIHVPGHSPGSAALHFPGQDALFVGDAINTYAVTSGRVGPQLSPFNADRAQALDSLRRIEDVQASLVLPGHGVVWREGVRSAVEAARATSG
jgi:glyoxylase-like metal-dependent hydrolase (beta-lactamase superfamily II)